MVNSGPGNADLKAKVFFVWGGCCGLCGLFVYFFIYETKGLSLEQVDELYDKVEFAWQSEQFVPSVNWADVKADDHAAKVAEIESVEKDRGVVQGNTA
jgi:SP family sugar:H+ symporter-like MFS transporter